MMTNNPERSARANIHPSTLNAMAKVASYNVMEDLGASRFAHSPSGVIPTNHSEPARPAERGGDGSGWQHEIPLVRNDQHPTPGVAACDRLLDAADARDKAAAQSQQGGGDYMALTLAMAKAVVEQQGQMLKLIADRESKK